MGKENKVKDILVKNVVCVDADKKIEDCAEIMSKNKIGALVVTNKQKVVGIITEQDLTRRVLAQGINPKKTKVNKIITRKVKSVDPDCSVDEAIAIMEENNIEHLPVIKNKKLEGIVTSKNVLRKIYADKYFMLSRKKIFFVAVVWVLLVIAKKVFPDILGWNIFFFLFAVIMIPLYFITAIVYTMYRRKILKGIDKKKRKN